MKIALDPYMHRPLPLPLPLEELPRLAAEWIELSPRPDVLERFRAAGVFPVRIKSFKKTLNGYAITAVADAGLEAADTGEAVEVTLAERPALYI